MGSGTETIASIYTLILNSKVVLYNGKKSNVVQCGGGLSGMEGSLAKSNA